MQPASSAKHTAPVSICEYIEEVCLCTLLISNEVHDGNLFVSCKAVMVWTMQVQPDNNSVHQVRQWQQHNMQNSRKNQQQQHEQQQARRGSSISGGRSSTVYETVMTAVAELHRGLLALPAADSAQRRLASLSMTASLESVQTSNASWYHTVHCHHGCAKCNPVWWCLAC